MDKYRLHGEYLLDRELENLRISALTNAASISPFIKKMTIGPNCDNTVYIEAKTDETEYNDNVLNLPETKLKNHQSRNADTNRNYINITEEYEKKWRGNANNLFKEMLERMVLRRVEYMDSYWRKQGEVYEKRTRELKNRTEKLLQRSNDQEKLPYTDDDTSVTNYLYNSKAIENMNKILEQQNMAAQHFASLTNIHTTIWNYYQEIIDAISSKSDASYKIILDKYEQPLTIILNNINYLMEICKTGQISNNEVIQAESLVKQMSDIKILIGDEIRDLEEQKKLADLAVEAERNKVHENLSKESVANSEPQNEIPAIENPNFETLNAGAPYFSQKSYENYISLTKYLQEYELLYKDLLVDPNMKKFRFDCQKAVNTPVNAISSLSGPHIREKFDKLYKLLKGERVLVADVHVSAAQHPQGLAYCTSLLARKIVRQGDTLVSSNPEAAFPLASVVISLWSHFPELGQLLQAYFFMECPYLVPMLLPQSEGQTDQEFYKSRGYSYSDEGTVEKQDKFLKRMTGIFRLCCAIWISKPTKVMSGSNPHGLRHAWRWLAAFINLKPEPDLSATLLFDFLTVCGNDFFKCYDKQFKKILHLILTDYMQILEKIDEGGPKTRLEVFLQNVIKRGQIDPPQGMLALRLW